MKLFLTRVPTPWLNLEGHLVTRHPCRRTGGAGHDGVRGIRPVRLVRAALRRVDTMLGGVLVTITI
jgi:hypothetical protein